MLGAALADWSYPASIPALLALTAQIGDVKASRKVMPWTLRLSAPEAKPTPDEVESAFEQLKDGIVFV